MTLEITSSPSLPVGPPKWPPMNRNRALAPHQIELEQDVSDSDLILAGLNQAQSTAVTTPASVVQILAPPGSGKTRTLTARVAYLLSEPQCLSPQNVIVATFTVKAAREMKERIAKLVGNGTEAKLILGTFHSIARRYLLKYGHLVGVKVGWGIADSGDSLGIIKRILRRMNLPITDASQIRSRISYFKARNSSPVANEVAQQRSTITATQTTQSTQQKEKSIANEDFVQVYQDYEAGLDASNLLDYDDLLLRCLELLKQHPECVSNVEAVLIDEFQDTNLVQFELMRLLASEANRITIVGDPDQSIYGFRAAEIRNLNRMLRHYPDTLIVHLEQNYRSSASILLAALEVIQQDDSRPQKPLTPTHIVGTRPVLRQLPSAQKEAWWIAGEIKRIKAVTGGVVGLGDVAILVRSASLTRLIEQAFVRYGLAYKMVGGSKFYDRVEIKTLLDYLRVVNNPSNNDALARIINVPGRKVGDMTIKALIDEAEKRGKTLWEVIHNGVSGHGWKEVKVGKVGEKGLGDFVGIILSTQRLLREESEPETEEGKTLVEVIEFLLRKLAFEDHLRRHYPEDWEGRWSNITELLSQAREMGGVDEDEDALPIIDGVEQNESVLTGLRGVLERFLANTTLANDVVGDEEKQKHGQITISTIHAAKGLEWPVVFIPAVYEGSIPHSRSDDTDEERRLLYVAMTRAQALLYMSVPRRNSQKEKTTLSPFLAPSSLGKLLEKRAPALAFSSVQNVLRILGRDCPSEDNIEAVIMDSRIPSLLDDQILEKEEWEEKEEADGEGGDQDDWRRRKRRWAEDETAVLGGDSDAFIRARKAAGWGPGRAAISTLSLTTAEQRLAAKTTTAEKLAAAAAAGTAGFRSAGSHMEQLKQNRLNCEADEGQAAKRTRHDVMVAKVAARSQQAGEKRAEIAAMAEARLSEPLKPRAAAGAKLNKRRASQGSLMSYFVPKPPAPKEVRPKQKTATEIIKQTKGQSLKDQMEALPQPKFPVRPDNGGVVLLSSSPIRVKAKRKDRAPSPPSSPVFMGFCKAIEGEKIGKSGAGAESGKASFASSSSVSRVVGQSLLPSKTITTTAITTITTAGFSSTSSISRNVQPQNASVGTGKKKTLGIRRSMNGWQNRASAKKN